MDGRTRLLRIALALVTLVALGAALLLAWLRLPVTP